MTVGLIRLAARAGLALDRGLLRLAEGFRRAAGRLADLVEWRRGQ